MPSPPERTGSPSPAAPGEPIARNVTRGAFYLAVEKGAAVLSGMVYFALLLRWLGPTKYGIITLALAFVGLATLATGNLEIYLERFAAEFEAQGRLRTLRHAYRVALGSKLLLGLLATGVVLALAPRISAWFGYPELAVLLPSLALIVACDGLATTGRAMLYGLQQFRWISVVSVAFHVAKTVMVGLLWWFRQGLPQLALALAVLTAAQGLVCTLIPTWMLRHARDPESAPAGDPGTLRSMLAYCTPLLGARVVSLSGPYLSKIVLGRLFDVALLGYFSFAFQTIERFVELAFTLPSALLPSLTQLVARGERERLRLVFDQAFRLIQCAACALSFGLFVFGPEVTRWVGSPLFLPAVPLLRIMSLAPFARIAQQPLHMLFQALRHPGTVLSLTLARFVVEFGGYVALVPAFGLAGAGWANLAGAAVAFLAAQLTLRRLVPEGADVRTRSTLLAFGALAPFLACALLSESLLHGTAALAVKLALVPAALITAFALSLVTREDLAILAGVPVGVAWMRAARDAAILAGDGLARAFAPRRAL